MEVELLSPVGDFESLRAAVNCGADAVYLGMSGFNARAKAKNFGDDELIEAVEYAHFRGVKVYVTLNTLVYNDEFDELFGLVKKALEAKVDAFIVQDLGVARFLRESFDGIELHASTQLGVHNLSGAEIAQKVGFKRVVLSRETKLEDIRKIKENTNLEIEFFVHGALCSSFSGNCLISSFKSGDSGNRGRCAQLCRLPYSTESKSGYLESTKDLCLIDSLQTLAAAGVTSFKIEGRLRRAGYVAIATRAYRKAIDSLGSLPNGLKNELLKAYSRGKFNETAYLYDNYDKLNISFNNHRGVKIGRLDEVKRFKNLYKLEISSSHDIAVGDGLKFFENGKEAGSLGVGSVENKNGKYYVFSAKSAAKGSDVYLTLDSRLEKEALSTEKKVPLQVDCMAISGQKLLVTAKSGNFKTVYESDFVLEKAKTQALTEKDFIDTFKKSDFCLEKLNLTTDGVFIAKSVLNECRRIALDSLKKEILKSFNKPITAKAVSIDSGSTFNNRGDNAVNVNKKRIIVVGNEREYNFAKEFDAMIAISPSSYFDKNLSDFLENHKVGLCLPIVAEQSEIKKFEALVLKSDFIVANNLWGLKWAEKVKTVAGTGLNVFNNYAVNELKDLGADNCIMSLELCKGGYNYGGEYYYSLGYPVLMNFVYCPFKELYGNGEKNCDKCRFKDVEYRDAKGNSYSIRRVKSGRCRFELLGQPINSVNKHLMNEFIDLRGFSADEFQSALDGKQVKPCESVGKLNLRIK